MGHKCCAGMPWEAPYVVFVLDDGREVIWHSENVESSLKKFDNLTLKTINDSWVRIRASFRLGKYGEWRVARMLGVEYQ